MTEPKIEFKKVKTFQGMEGEGLNADIYINGVKCLFMRDSGDGGEVDFDIIVSKDNAVLYHRVTGLIKLVDAWIATIPDVVHPLTNDTFGRKELRIKADYESYFDDKYNEFMKAKGTAKFEKQKHLLFKTAIVFGNPATPEKFQFLNFKKPLNELPLAKLQNEVNKAKLAYCKKGVDFLNKNHLTSLGIIL